MARCPETRPSRVIVQTARLNRRNPTPAEAKLWEALRDRRLNGMKFRRQCPYGRFILDYYCALWSLVLEIDGGIHDEPDQAARDAERTEWLALHGIRVMRLRNEEVLHDLESALARIVAACASPPAPLLAAGADNGER